MFRENPLWGAPRILSELLLLGYHAAERTMAKYMARTRKPPSQTWPTFLANHVPDIAACDFFTVPTVPFRVLYVFMVLRHDRRRVVHFIRYPCGHFLPWPHPDDILAKDRYGAFPAGHVSRLVGGAAARHALSRVRSGDQAAGEAGQLGADLQFDGQLRGNSS